MPEAEDSPNAAEEPSFGPYETVKAGMSLSVFAQKTPEVCR